MIHTVTIPFGEDRELVLETGRIARQAHGTVTARIGDTVVMVNTVRDNKAKEDLDFFPLTVDFREKHYAAGRIPGNFFRREGRPGTQETINARLIDRAIRPLFPKGFKYETQVYVTILSFDGKNPTRVPALIAASAALSISDIPFAGPVGAIRLGSVGGKLIVNPTLEEDEESELDLVVAGTADALTMVESGADCVTEADVLKAMLDGQAEVEKVVAGITELVALAGVEKMVFEAPETDAAIVAAVDEAIGSRLDAIDGETDKATREDSVKAARNGVVEAVAAKFADADPAPPKLERQTKDLFDDAYKKHMRGQVIKTKVRADGRALDEVRDITTEAGYIPMAHGSAIFTRGQTQALGVTTLGTVGDQQKIDDLIGFYTEDFLVHYNFPSYSVGETRRIMGPGRRELGHGDLARRGMEAVLPEKEDFPYTIRVVSEILESNGSSSMASVCAGCLSMLDAGVPLKAPVAGIAMGMIQEGDDVAILTDIMGMEDHLGDMDFKVAGTREGITALQMDIKMEGLDSAVLEKALAQARVARHHILDKMAELLPEHRPELSPHAPRIEVIQIDPQRIGDLIGPSGKHIRGIVEATGAKVDVEDDGSVFIAASDGDAMDMARQMVNDLTADVEVGKIYEGKVVRITDFGCFVEILPKKDGLVHISELDKERVDQVTDICREGDMVKVKVISVDDTGRVRLSRRLAVYPDEVERPAQSGGGGGRDRGSRDRGPRGGGGRDRGGRDRGGRDRGGRDRGGNR